MSSNSPASQTEDTAPIALFVFARPDHTARTLAALTANSLASQSDLIVFHDGPRADTDLRAHQQTADIVRQASGFRSVRYVLRPQNRGLAQSLYSGVSEVLKEHDRVIVVEDDLVTAPHFLTFMNQALTHYRDMQEVWHVSGWNYAIDPAGLGDAFFWRVMNCWGWATWTDRWQHFEFDRKQIAAGFDRQSRRRFNIDGAYDFHRQIRDNLDGKIQTWAIFWYATIFQHGGLCLNPACTLVENIGLDSSGENCDDKPVVQHLAQVQDSFELPETPVENALAVERVRRYFAGSGWKSLVRRALRQITI